MVNSESGSKGGEKDDVKSKIRIPGEGDVISGGGLPIGKKFVVDGHEEESPGVLTLSLRKLAPDGSYDPSSKKEEVSIVVDAKSTVDVEELRFHNKMKKDFVPKGKK